MLGLISRIQIFKYLNPFSEIFLHFKTETFPNRQQKLNICLCPEDKISLCQHAFYTIEASKEKCRNGCFFFLMKLKRKISEKLNTWFISAYNKRRWRSSLCLCFILKSASQHLSGPLVSNMMAIRFQQSR